MIEEDDAIWQPPSPGRPTWRWPPNCCIRGAWSSSRTRTSRHFRSPTRHFDLVISRHPTTVWWAEIARVLRPAGAYFAQHVGPATAFELVEYFLGPQPEARRKRHPDNECIAAQAAGLEVLDVRMERLRMEFFDIGAVIYFLRKVIWTVPDFSVDRYRDRLRDLQEQIESEGRFVAYSSRLLIEAGKPI